MQLTSFYSTAFTLPFFFALIACSGGGPAGSTPDASVDGSPADDASPTHDASPTNDASANDAGADGGACTELALPAADVTSECPNPSAPLPTGGALADGTYALTHVASWSSACGGYKWTLSEALRVREGSIELATQVKSRTNVGALGARTRGFVATQVDPTSINLTPVCDVHTDAGDAGDVEQTLGEGGYEYSASATELRFFERGTSSRLLAIYQRQ